MGIGTSDVIEQVEETTVMATSLAAFGLPYWLDFPRPTFPGLDGNQTADAVVIGAGIAGLKLARCLSRHGLKVVVLEGAHVGAGASSRNQGTIDHGPNLGYQECIQLHSRQVARDLWRLGLENQRMICEQIADYAIDCGYAAGGMTFLVRHDIPGWKERLADFRADAGLLQEDGFNVDVLDEREAARVGSGNLYCGGLRYNTDAQFHSGRFVVGLAQGVAQLPKVRLYERVRVHTIERQGTATRVSADCGSVVAPVVFLATNALVPQYVPKLERALRAERGQVLVTEPLDFRPCAGSFGTSLAWWREIREADGRYRLLFGGGRTRDEPDSLLPQYRRDGAPHPLLEAEGFSPSAAHQQRLNTQLALLFPEVARARVTYRWAGLQSFTADNLPEIGLFDEERQIYGMAGFCGRGNCHSDVGADYLAGKIAGVASDIEQRFGYLFETLMRVGRESANWGGWRSSFAD
jgi:glycine/D-amino acid oxidase-like deaminating enzyme